MYSYFFEYMLKVISLNNKLFINFVIILIKKKSEYNICIVILLSIC